ncbi:MAG: hypothetical protein WB565_13220 [Acidimicrobiales bacterium]
MPVAGSSGHLGEALLRVLTADGYEVPVVDLVPLALIETVESITDQSVICRPSQMCSEDASISRKRGFASSEDSHLTDRKRWVAEQSDVTRIS